MNDWRYTWLHIPTATKGERTLAYGELQVYTRKDLLERLNAWNASQPGTWQYWTN